MGGRGGAGEAELESEALGGQAAGGCVPREAVHGEALAGELLLKEEYPSSVVPPGTTHRSHHFLCHPREPCTNRAHPLSSLGVIRRSHGGHSGRWPVREILPGSSKTVFWVDKDIDMGKVAFSTLGLDINICHLESHSHPNPTGQGPCSARHHQPC